jgi:hypothetical protein
MLGTGEESSVHADFIAGENQYCTGDDTHHPDLKVQPLRMPELIIRRATETAAVDQWMDTVADSVLREAIGIERLYGLIEYPEIGWLMVDSVIATLKDLRPKLGGVVHAWEALDLSMNADPARLDEGSPMWVLKLELLRFARPAIVEISDQGYELTIPPVERVPITSWGSQQIHGYTTHPR